MADVTTIDLGNVRGEKGDKGDTGAQGAHGLPGAKGDKGDTGATGAAGDPLSTLKAYPVGTIYMSMSATSPASLFGGTWKAITGRFPYFNAGVGTGGANSHTHTLSGAGGACVDNECNTSYHLNLTGRRNGTPTFSPSVKFSVQGTAHNTSLGEALNNTAALTGRTDSASNMPAYQTVYAWQRTA